MKTLPVDMDELMSAVETDPHMQMAWFLNVETGKVIFTSDGDDEDDETAADIDDHPERYKEVPTIETREQYRWMATFSETVRDKRIAARLEDALIGKGAFSRFRRVLHDDAELREEWEVFRHERVLSFV